MVAISIYVVLSIVLAVVVHAGAVSGPQDRASTAIEARYLTGSPLSAIWCLLLWAMFFYLCRDASHWWIPALMSLPGGVTLRFAVLNMSKLVAGRDEFKDQVRDVLTLIQAGTQARAEVFTYFEPPARMRDQLGHMMLIDQFRQNSKLGIAHGRGRGHALVRVEFLKNVVRGHPGPIADYASLVRAFRASGYEVIRSETTSYE